MQARSSAWVDWNNSLRLTNEPPPPTNLSGSYSNFRLRVASVVAFWAYSRQAAGERAVSTPYPRLCPLLWLHFGKCSAPFLPKTRASSTGEQTWLTDRSPRATREGKTYSRQSHHTFWVRVFACSVGQEYPAFWLAAAARSALRKTRDRIHTFLFAPVPQLTAATGQ